MTGGRARNHEEVPVHEGQDDPALLPEHERVQPLGDVELLPEEFPQELLFGMLLG
jgi:hypothetical protein